MNITRDERHRYFVDGVLWPGVTSVLKVINRPQLNRWREQQGTRQADSIANTAADHGHLVHAMASLYAEGVPFVPLSEEEAANVGPRVEAFFCWYEANVEEFYGTELFVAHPQYHYAGTLDFLLRLRGDDCPTLVDVKSGKSVWPEARAQTAAYREAALCGILAELGFKKCRRGVLHVPEGCKEAKFKEHGNHADDLQAFLSALYLTQWLKS